MAALPQVDHGDANGPVSYQGLDGMNVSARIYTDPFVDSCLEDGIGNG